MKTNLADAGAYQPDHPDSLAVYCSDGRFTSAVEGLFNDLGHPRLDTLTIPGGPAVLDSNTSGLFEADALRRAATFLITAHHIRHVILVAHLGCGYYRAKDPYDDADTTRKKQFDDLESVAAWMKSAHHGLDVATYFARPEGGRVCFDRLDLG